MKNIFLLLFILILLFFYLGAKKSFSKLFKKNVRISNFKKTSLSKESNINKIFLRNDERLNLNPNINIQINLNEQEYQIINKTNIHRSRLAKFKKSKFNGDIIYLDEDEKVYKVINGIKKYL